MEPYTLLIAIMEMKKNDRKLFSGVLKMFGFRVRWVCCLFDGRFVRSINQCIPSHRNTNDLCANEHYFDMRRAWEEFVPYSLHGVETWDKRRWSMSFDKFQGVSRKWDARMHSIGWQYSIEMKGFSVPSIMHAMNHYEQILT